MASILDPLTNCDSREICGVKVDVARTGAVRVKRMIYPPGFHWDQEMSKVVGTEYCMHAHVGFMAQGQINVEYQDGCVEEFKAPQFVAVESGHKGWVVGDEPAVLIEFDFEGDTVNRLALPTIHQPGAKH
ncbi:MAG: hypothetical protein ABI811_01085 [Acidobacteriota bacterium]